MENIVEIINQKPKLFEQLANRWHQLTGGRLALLSIKGDVIKSNSVSPATFDPLIDKSLAGDVNVLDQSNAMLVPFIIGQTKRGYLLSKDAPNMYLPMLNWIADMLMQYADAESALDGMTDELISAWGQLDLVYRITQTLAEKSNLPDALNSILQEVISVIKVEAGFIIFEHNGSLDTAVAGNKQLPELVFQHGFVNKLTKLNNLVLVNDRRSLLDKWSQAPLEFQTFMGASITTSTNTETAAVLGLINKKQRVFSAGDVKLTTSVAEQIGAIIDNFRLQQELIAQERISRELEIAAEIQESLLPKVIPDVSGLSVDFNLMPAYEVGGDFYDFISPVEHQMAVVIGDVAGKGIPAAMFTSMVRTVLRIEAYHSQEPHSIIKRANEVLHQDLSQAELFVTAFVAIFDTKNNVLMYANAGHTPGIIYHAQSKTSRLLKATSLPLGIIGYDSRTTQYVHINPGDTLVLFSDGISEARNPQEEVFGLNRVQRLILDNADKSPETLKNIILQEVAAFQQREIVADDITLVVVKFSGEPKPAYLIQDWDILKTIPFNYKADTIHLSDISRQITTACRSLENLPPDSKGDDFIYLVELAVSEICTNMIEHAYANKEGQITGEIMLTSAGVQIDVYDQGDSFNPNAVPPPMSDPMDPTEGGYGLHIVRQIMDIANYEANTPKGNHWRLVKYIP